MPARKRHELLTQLVRLERELSCVRRKLRSEQAPAPLSQASVQALRVQVGMREYAVPSGCVRQIIRYAVPAPVDLATRAVKGALAIGGESIVVVDLGERLGHGPTPVDADTALVIASVHDFLVALIIERVSDAIRLDSLDQVLVLDLEQLLSSSELELLTLALQNSRASR